MVSVMTWYSFYLWNRSRSDKLHKLGHRSLCYWQLCSQVFLHNLFVVVVVLADCSIGQHHLDHLSVMLGSLELYRREVELELTLAEHLILSLLSSLFFLQIWMIYFIWLPFSDSLSGCMSRDSDCTYIPLQVSHLFGGIKLTISEHWWQKYWHISFFASILFTMNI